jgi:hypothetical protein
MGTRAAKKLSAACDHTNILVFPTNQGSRLKCLDCGVVGPIREEAWLATEGPISVREVAQKLGIPLEAARALVQAGLRS